MTALMTEASLMSFAADYLRQRGWLVYHPRPARTAQGWRTAGEYDAKGFPDLCCARGGEVRLIEVKGPRGKVSAEQSTWLVASDGYVLTPGWVDHFIEEFK